MTPSATIYLGEDRILVCPLDTIAEVGANLTGGPVRTLRHGAAVDEILRELELSLRDCKVVPMQNSKKHFEALIIASGEKTWNAITRSYACVSVEKRDSQLRHPRKGSFIVQRGAHGSCNGSDRTEVATAFLTAARVTMEAKTSTIRRHSTNYKLLPRVFAPLRLRVKSSSRIIAAAEPLRSVGS